MAYFITAIHLDTESDKDDTRSIEECEVYTPFGYTTRQTKDEICTNIDSLHLSYKVNYGVKPDVIVVHENNDKFLRSKKNDIEKDNLLNLPRF